MKILIIIYALIWLWHWYEIKHAQTIDKDDPDF